MKIRRRTFLEIAGLSALAVAERKLPAVLGAGHRGKTAPAAERRTAVRWAMAIDLRRCTPQRGCTDCIAACDKAHNIPQIKEPAHEVKWIWKEPFSNAFPDRQSRYAEEIFRDLPVPVLCYHCDNPPCARVCPTGATWKREDGIVMMDWHRCIGCKYCIVACPYGSRSFNFFDPRPYIKQLNPDFPTRESGVVEKCNFCEERLAQGKQPACADACREKALVFGNLKDPGSEIRELLRRRYAIRSKPELGTRPQVYYLV